MISTMKNIRRAFIFFLIVAFNFFTYADEKEEVRAFVDGVASNVIEIVGSKDAYGIKANKLRSTMDKTFDLEWMARFTLATSYRNLADSQKKVFNQLYADYLFYSYLPNLMRFNNESFRILRVKNIDEKNFLVDTEILRHDGKAPISINYLIKRNKNSAELKVVDMIIENISTISAQRSEFSEVVASKGIDGLFSAMKDRNQKNYKEAATR